LEVAEVGKGVAVTPCWGFPKLSPIKALSKPRNDNFFMKLSRTQINTIVCSFIQKKNIVQLLNFNYKIEICYRKKNNPQPF